MSYATFHKRILLAGALMVACMHGLSAQDANDPLLQSPLSREAASFPTPWGVVLTLRIPLAGIGSVSSDGDSHYPVPYIAKARTTMRICANVYYDTWQLGLNYKEYGNTITIMSRTAVNEALSDLGDDSYLKAAPKAAKNLFDPEYWKGSFMEFPSRSAKKKKL